MEKMEKETKCKFMKSSYSYHNDRCVEIYIGDEKVTVRNSKSPYKATSFTLEEWQAFIEGVKNNEFNLSKK